MFDFVGCQRSAEDSNTEGNSFLTFTSDASNPWLTISKIAGRFYIKRMREGHLFGFEKIIPWAAEGSPLHICLSNYVSFDLSNFFKRLKVDFLSFLSWILYFNVRPSILAEHHSSNAYSGHVGIHQRWNDSYHDSSRFWNHSWLFIPESCLQNWSPNRLTRRSL